MTFIDALPVFTGCVSIGLIATNPVPASAILRVCQRIDAPAIVGDDIGIRAIDKAGPFHAIGTGSTTVSAAPAIVIGPDICLTPIGGNPVTVIPTLIAAHHRTLVIRTITVPVV
jgi:hypothetical protein